jgi:hypothetical protein
VEYPNDVEDLVQRVKPGGVLLSGTTYYIPIGGAASTVQSAHCKWDASIVITSITVEVSNFRIQNDNDPNPTDSAGDAGDWIPYTPSSGAYVAVTGAGVTATGAVVAATGGAAGGCFYDIGNLGARRARLAVVVGGTGGRFRVASHGKA